MAALLIGLCALLVTFYIILPFGLHWWPDVVLFIRGAFPVILFFVGIVSVVIGIADLKDRSDAKKEEAEEEALSEAVSKDEE